MNNLQWINDDYSVHIPAIDNEHKLLVALINEIAGLMSETQGSFQIQEIIEKLSNLSHCIKIHFDSEEKFLITNNYPGYEKHKAEHTFLLKRLAEFDARFKAANKGFNDKMLLFLKDWLVRHMILYDQEFGHYFKGKEIVLMK